MKKHIIVALSAAVMLSGCNKKEEKAVKAPTPEKKIQVKDDTHQKDLMKKADDHSDHDHSGHEQAVIEEQKTERPLFKIPKAQKKILPDPLTGMIYAKYNDIYKNLITDNYKDAVKTAKTFTQSLVNVPAKLSASMTKKKLVESSKAVEAAKNMEELRFAFLTLSENLITVLAENSYEGELPAYAAYCPMYKNTKKAYWIQPEEKGTQDPYHDKSMRRCGRVEKEL